jgi:DNA-binding response OmpR family regulator
MPSKVILLLNDNPSTREILKNFLIDSGFEVLVAERENKCFQYLSSRYVDLVLLDIIRDNLTEFLITKKIKNISKRKHTPVISIIQNDKFNNSIDIPVESDDYVTKPVDKKILLEKIEYLTDKYFY